MQVLTKEYLLWLFHYDRENGKLYWKNHWHQSTLTRFKGKEAGAIGKHGYKTVRIDGSSFLIHRLIFFIENEGVIDLIDHINGDLLDNRILNLRAVNNRKNQQNQYRHRKGKLIGTCYHIRAKRWYCSIRINKKDIYLGYSDTEIEAHQRYVQELKARGLS